jgi:UDP-glucose 4-epimerase
LQTVLVTGGAGFIGSHLVAALRERGSRVRVFDDLSTGTRENLAEFGDAEFGDDVEFLEGDVADAGAVREACRDVELVFHLASLVSVPKSVEDPLLAHAATATGTLNVLEAARAHGVRRVVYSGSCAVYGNGYEGAIHERLPPSLLSPYAAAKFAGEAYCEAFSRSLGVETVRLRYFNVFGPRQDPHGPYSAVIPLFVSKVLAGERPVVHGDGGQTRDFVYVDNVVRANLLAAEAPADVAVGNVYNVGTGASRSVLDMLRTVCETLERPCEPEFGPARVGDVMHSRADITAAERDLDYQPSVDFDTGLRRTIEWFAEHPA